MTESVLTFVAGPGFAGSWEGVRSVAVEALWRLGADLESMEWLAPERAVDLPFGNLDPEQAETAVRAALREQIGDIALDVVAQRQAQRRKRLLLADMESTVIANEMLDELAEILGLGPHVAELTARAMNGEIDFAAALRERVALLRGKPTASLDEAARRIRTNPGARELVATMRGDGAFTVLVSGGFRTFTGLVRAELGFDLDIANELAIDGSEIAGSASSDRPRRPDGAPLRAGVSGGRDQAVTTLTLPSLRNGRVRVPETASPCRRCAAPSSRARLGGRSASARICGRLSSLPRPCRRPERGSSPPLAPPRR